MEYVLRTDNICKHYRKTNALNNVTMNVPKGSIYGFVGKNGAGKTTLMRIICGLQFQSGGDFELYGEKSDSAEIGKVRRRIGAVIETPALNSAMTAENNIKQHYRLLGIPTFDGIPELLKLVGLENTGRKITRDFSLGMRQRLGIAIALCGEPDFLVLDEPINGLDPQGIIEIRELILKLNRERNITVLISSHILDELSRLATHYGFIDNGHIVKELSADELETACHKCIRMTVTDMAALSRTLDEAQTEYKIIDKTTVDVFASPNITRLALALVKENCEILTVTEHNEELEGFFISLVGGGNND